jgi:hypothetical protein
LPKQPESEPENPQCGEKEAGSAAYRCALAGLSKVFFSHWGLKHTLVLVL